MDHYDHHTSMRNIIPTALLLVSLISPAFAITVADLDPAALAGKTLTFFIEFGAAPFASDGSWTGTFETSPANGFTIKRITGATVDISATQAFNGIAEGVISSYTITPLIAGQSPGLLEFWTTSDGVGHYEISNEGIFQGGTFTIGTSANTPDQRSTGSKLSVKSSKKNFSKLQVGKRSTPTIYTIKNTGGVPLTKLSITKSGPAARDFLIGKPGMTSLAVGASTSFKVIFKPTATGTRSAAIQIFNDENLYPLKITVTGRGIR